MHSKDICKSKELLKQSLRVDEEIATIIVHVMSYDLLEFMQPCTGHMTYLNSCSHVQVI